MSIDKVWSPGWRRRSVLKAFAALGIAAAGGHRLIPAARADDAAGEIIMREIPASGERIPAMGLGTARTFNVGDADAASDEVLAPLREVLRVFFDRGGRLVDTSPMYGTAEQLVGRFAEELDLAGELFIATKVWTDGRDAGKRQMARSMTLMHSDPVDMMQIHNLRDWRTHYRTLREWQDQGRIRYIGITRSQTAAHAEVERVLKAERFDVLQINYNALDRNADQRLLPLAQDQGLAVLINEPFGNGRLFTHVRGHEPPQWVRAFDAETWAQVFLKYILAHPAVTCPIPATSNPEHAADNMGAAYGRLPDEDERQRIASHLEAL